MSKIEKTDAEWRESLSPEAYRVLRPGSRFLCLEFSTVDVPGLDALYDFFSFKVIPPLGRAVTGTSLVVAMRDIVPGEELSFDYAMCDASDYDEFRCLCGESTCRGIVTGSDWRDPVLQAKYAGWFSPYLARRIAALPSRGTS